MSGLGSLLPAFVTASLVLLRTVAPLSAQVVPAAAFGAFVSLVLCYEDCVEEGLVAAAVAAVVGGASGALLGGLIGYAIPKWHRRYP